LLGAVIALLAAVAVCRFYRVKWALEERLGQREDGAPYAPLPGVPMPPPHPPHKGNGRDD
jgi:hypothetical protein